MFLLSIAAIVLSVVAISKANGMSILVKRLEERIKIIELEKTSSNSSKVGESLPEHALENAIDIQSGDSIELKKVSTEVKEKAIGDSGESGFVTWLKEDWLLKLGGILVIMGALFFLSIAYTAVGVQGKVVIGYIFGLILMVGGFLYAKRQIVGGGAIHVIGAIVILLTTYLARQPQYNLFDPVLALLLMFFISSCVALTAFAYKREQLAHISLVMSGIVPILTNSGNNNLTGLLVYLLVVIAGVLWLAFVTEWRTLVMTGLILLITYSVSFTGGWSGSIPLTSVQILLVTGFGIIFYLTSLLSIMRSGGKPHQADGIVAVLNAIFALIWIVGKATHEHAPIIIALVALIYAVGFFCVYKITNVYTSFIVYGSVALGMLTTAIMLRLEGRAETVALLLIGGGVTALTWYLSKKEDITKVVAFFNIIPGAYVVVAIGRIQLALYQARMTDAVWKDLWIIVLAMAIYYSLYAYFTKATDNLKYLFLWLGNMVNIVFLWQIIHFLVPGGAGTLVCIALYTVIGLVVLFIGVQNSNSAIIKYSKIWLGLVAARVVFWDAWQVGNPTLSVFICIIIGVLLLSSAFIIKKVTEVR